MNTIHKITRLLIISLLTITHTQAENDKNAWYIGIGAVLSKLQPITTGTNFNVTDDDSHSGYQLIVGNRLHHNFALELSYADLSKADVANTNQTITGGINYQQTTFGGILYPWGEEKVNEWASPFVGYGVRYTNNSTDNDAIIFKRVDKYEDYMQVGLDISTSEIWNVRLSYKKYSDDSSIFAVGIVVPIF